MTANGNLHRDSLPNSDNITRVVLDNGIKVLVYEKHATQSVVISGLLHAGSLFETPEKNGLASLTADALMYGTQSRDFDTLHAQLEEIGADLDVNGGRHRTGFGGKALAEDLPTLFELLADVLQNPAFPADHVERLRGQLMTGLNYQQQDTRYRASRAFDETLYPEGHPYHYDTNGTLETVPALSIDDMRAFHNTNYGPKDMIVVIVGAVKASEAVDIVKAQLGGWQNPQQPAIPVMPDAPTVEETRRVYATVPGKTQADIVMGAVGPSRYADDYIPATIANSVLGRFGMMGRIGDIVREKMGLAYYAYSSINGGPGPRPWKVIAGVAPQNVDAAVDAIHNELRRLVTEPVSESDLSDNQAYVTGRLPLQLESNEGVAGAIRSMETYDLGLDHLVEYQAMVNNLTQDDLLQASKNYLDPEALVISVAGP